MRIAKFLNKDAIKIEMESTIKKGVIEELVDKLISARKIKKDLRAKVIRSLVEREKRGSTGIGQGIAIPHARSDSLKNVVLAFGNSSKGVDFNALDGEQVYIIFLLIAPRDSTGQHLKVLAKISRLLKDKFFRMELKEAKTPAEILKIIDEEDR